MKAGDLVTPTDGKFKGREFEVVRKKSSTVTVRVLRYFSIEDEYDCEDWEAGDYIDIPLSCFKDERQVLEREIRATACTLRGLLLKKKSLDNPLETEKEIKKLLECVDL